jgi:hypothetical protein
MSDLSSRPSPGDEVTAAWSQFLPGLSAQGVGAAEQDAIRTVTPMALVGSTLLASVPDLEAKDAVSAELSGLIARDLGALLGCDLTLAITALAVPAQPARIAAEIRDGKIPAGAWVGKSASVAGGLQVPFPAHGRLLVDPDGQGNAAG